MERVRTARVQSIAGSNEPRRGFGPVRACVRLSVGVWGESGEGEEEVKEGLQPQAQIS